MPNNNSPRNEEKTPLTGTSMSEFSEEKTVPTVNPADEINPFHVYLKYYQRYLSDENSTLEDLLEACRALSLSACLGYKGATSSFMSKPKSWLSCNLLQIAANELKVRLEQISLESPDYDQAQLALFEHYYARRHYTNYTHHDERFADIYFGLKHFCTRKNLQIPLEDPRLEHFFQSVLLGYPNEVNEDKIVESAWRILTNELLGQDPLSEAFLLGAPDNVSIMVGHYPFPIVPINTMRNISKALEHDPAQTNNFLQGYNAYRNENINTLDCSAEHNQSYVLNIPVEWLQDPNKPILCFRDKKTHQEVARFELSQGKIVFKACGKPINLKIIGQLAVSTFVLENPGSSVKLTTDLQTEQPVALAADMDHFTLNGSIQSSQQIAVESSGQIDIPKQSIVHSSNSNIFIKAKALDMRGNIESKGLCEWLIKDSVVMAPKSQCYGKRGMKITAGSLKKIRGIIHSDGPMEIEADSNICLRGLGKLSAKSLSIETTAMTTTGKTIVIADESIYVDRLEKLLIDKESAWSASDIRIKAKMFKDYSPNFYAKTTHIHCEDSFTLYPEGKINIQERSLFTGGSVWSAGEIDFGQQIIFKLNKFFVLGLADISSFSRVKEFFRSSKFRGSNASIIAGTFLNFFGGIKARNLSVSCILRVSIDFQVLKATQQSCIFKVGSGITIPNIQAYYDDVKKCISLFSIGEYKKAAKIYANEEGAVSALSGIRSLVRTLLPILGKSVDFAYNAIMAAYSSKKLYKQAVALNEARKNRPIELSDFIQLAALAANVTTQWVMVESQRETLENPTFEWAEPSTYRIPTLVFSCVSMFLLSNLDDSVAGIELGSLQTNGSVIRRSFFDFSAYSSQIGLNVSNTFYMSNQSNVLAVGNTVYNTGNQLNHSGVTIGLGVSNNASQQTEDGLLIGADVSIQGKQAKLNGTTLALTLKEAVSNRIEDASNTRVKDHATYSTANYEQKAANAIAAGDMSVQADKASLAGKMQVDNIQVLANDLTDASHINARGHADLIGKHSLERTTESDLTAQWINVSSDGKNTNEGSVHCTAPAESIPAAEKAADSIAGENTESKNDPITPPPAEEKKNKPVPHVIFHGNDVILSTTSNINAPGQTTYIDSENTSDNGTSNGATYVDNAKQHINEGKDARHNATAAVVLQSKTATLQGQNNTSNLVLNIDDLTGQQVDEILSGTGEAQHYRPNDLLSIKTTNDIALPKNYDLPFSVEMNGNHIDIFGNMHSTGDLIFTASVGDISNYANHLRADGNLIFNAINGAFNNFRGNLSGKFTYVHSRGNITNIAGTLQAETQLRLISDAGGLVNQGDLRNQVYTGARLIGGNGKGYDNMGLAIKTDGTLLNKGSSITSQANAVLDVGRVDNVADDYTIIETKVVTDPVPLTNAENLALYSAESRPAVTIITKQGSEVIPTGSCPDPNSRATLVLDRVHDTTSIVVTPPASRTVSVAADHTASSHIEVKDTLSAEVKRGDWNNIHSTAVANDIEMNISHGNFNNIASLTQGNTHVEVHANDINNIALAHTIDGALGGEEKTYEAGVLLGGTGQGHDGIGMVLQADGVIHLLGSIISSEGDNVLLGKHGIDSRAMHNTYISYHRETSNWCGRDTETTEYSERIQPAVVFSANGSNYMVSSEGNIYSVSTEFLAARDNVFIGKYNIDLLGLITDTRVDKDVSTLFGINDHKTSQTDEMAIPTVVVNPANAKFESLEGNVRLLNAAVVGQNKVEINTPNGSTEISAPILNHTLIDESRSLGINSPALSNGLNVFPVYQDAHALSRANNATEYAASAWNTAIDTMNAISNTMAGAKNNSAKQSLFSASYLTGIELSYTYSKTTQTFQTVANNVGINCGTLVINAGNKIVFSNGVNVTVLHLADLTATEFWQLGAKLESAFEKNTVTANLGTSIEGEINVGGGVTHADAQGTTYVNQTFTVGGTAVIHVQQWNMRNANTNANDLKAVTDLLSIVSDTNKSEGHSWSGQVNTNGDVSAQSGTNQSAVIGTPSGIQANTIGMVSHKTTLEAAVINAGSGSFKTDILESKSVDQYSKSDSFGISTNINSDKSPSSGAFEKPITTTNVSSSDKDYQATQVSTVYIQQGPGLEVKDSHGSVNTANASGLEVSKDEQYALTLKVPDSEKSWQQVKDNLAPISKQPGNINHVDASIPAYTQLSDQPVQEGSNDADSNHHDEDEEKHNISPFEQDTVNQRISENKEEISDVKLSTNINTNDTKYSNYLSEIASDTEIKPEKVDYLMQASRVAYYAPMITGGKLGGQSSSALSGNSFFKKADSISTEFESKLGFFGGLKNAVVDAYFSPDNWSKASLENLRVITEDIGLEYIDIGNMRQAFGRETFDMLNGNFMEGEAGVAKNAVIAKLENTIGSEFVDYGKKLAVYPKYAIGALYGYEVIELIDKVMDAPPEQRFRVAFVDGAELYGQKFGADLGIAEAGILLYGSRGRSLFRSIPIIVGTSAAGGYVFKRTAEELLDCYDNIKKRGN